MTNIAKEMKQKPYNANHNKLTCSIWFCVIAKIRQRKQLVLANEAKIYVTSCSCNQTIITKLKKKNKCRWGERERGKEKTLPKKSFFFLFVH